jgi:hypothetical protein
MDKPTNITATVDIATGYWQDSRGSIPSRSKIFLFPTAPGPTPGPTQPPMQWIPGTSWPGCKAAGGEKLTKHHLVSWLTMVSYTSTSPHISSGRSA